MMVKKKVKKVLKAKVTKKVITKDFVWTPEMSVHDVIIDNQHKTLIAKINELTKEANTNDIGVARGVINFLGKYAVEHFNTEENYMKKYGYPQLKEHHKKHEEFKVFFEKYKKEFDDLYRTKKLDSFVLPELLVKAKKYLSDWTDHHIMTHDQKYAKYIDKKKAKSTKGFDISKVKAEIQKSLKKGDIQDHQAQILEQRAPVESISHLKEGKGKKIKGYILTGISGFDSLLENGIPQGNSVLVAGGAGSGKTIFCLQTLAYHASKGDKCFYMSFEESEERLKQHMKDFGWDADKLVKNGKLKIARYSPFDITRSVDAMLAKEKGELLIDIEPIIIPSNFKPDYIVLDSLTAIASAFTGKDDSYRIYIEQLFRFFERLGSTSFLITETEQVPKIFSTTGVEEFLADGVIVLYNIKRGDMRENALEILKMRGEKHQKKIVAMQITDKGIMVYPEQEVFGGLAES